MSALYEHCVRVYDTMADKARPRKIEGLDFDLVYEGTLTRLFTEELGLSIPYYSNVMHQLKRMGCVEQIRRGGGGSPSLWALLYEPTKDLWHQDAPKHKNTKESGQNMLQQQISDLNKRLTKVENMLYGEAPSVKEAS